MIKKYLLIAVIFLQFTSIYAQNYMYVNLKNGSKVVYDLSEIGKIDFSGVTNIDDANQMAKIIKSFKLRQNYPNPFNPSTTIQYEIPKAGKVELNIYDLSGRLVKKLLSAFQQAGLHGEKWNGLNESGKKVSSGFYIYSVKFENCIYSKKMILLK